VVNVPNHRQSVVFATVMAMTASFAPMTAMIE